MLSRIMPDSNGHKQSDSVPQPDVELLHLAQMIEEQQLWVVTPEELPHLAQIIEEQHLKILALEGALRAKRGEGSSHRLPRGAPPKTYTVAARAAIESGTTYLGTLWHAALDTIQRDGRPISDEKARAILKAVGREWRRHHGNAPHVRPPQGWSGSVQERSRHFLKWAIDTSELRHSAPKKITERSRPPQTAPCRAVSSATDEALGLF